jgi:hypothetical protein
VISVVVFTTPHGCATRTRDWTRSSLTPAPELGRTERLPGGAGPQLPPQRVGVDTKCAQQLYRQAVADLEYAE